MTTITIGNVKIEKSCALSPMASVADRAYRLMCRKFGACMLTGEMVSAKGLCYSSAKTRELCSVTDEERPYALQLFGEEPQFIAQAVRIVNGFKPDMIDINMGCPVPKVVNPGGGSALMKTPELASEIVKAAVANADCPVTVKIRSGWDENSINAVEFACLMERSGASAVSVHARTSRQMYSGRADWSVIKAVKDALGIPVIGNGDVCSGEDAARMYAETGCDLVSLARASYGRPWVFAQIRSYLETKTILPEPPLERRMQIMLEHVRLLVSEKGEETGIREARKNVAWYFKGLKGAAGFRQRAGNIKSVAEVELMAEQALKLYDADGGDGSGTAY